MDIVVQEEVKVDNVNTYQEERKDDTPNKDPFGNIKPYGYSTIISAFPSYSGSPLFISDPQDRSFRLQDEGEGKRGKRDAGGSGLGRRRERRTCSDEIIVTATKISNP